MKRFFKSLSEAEKLALAISLEEDEANLYKEFARRMRPHRPHVAAELESPRQEEVDHAHRLRAVFETHFGTEIPLVRRNDVAGFIPTFELPGEGRLDLEQINKHVRLAEAEIARFYARAVERCTTPGVRRAFEELATIEQQHQSLNLRIDAAGRLDERALMDPRRHLFLWRGLPHPAVPHPDVFLGYHRGHRRRLGETDGHLLGPQPVYGHSVRSLGIPGVGG